MVLGALGAGALGGAGINIIIRAVDKFSGVFALVNKRLLLMGTISVVAGALIVSGFVKAGKAAAEVETEYAKVNTLLEKGQDAQKLYGKFIQETNVLMGNQGDQISALSGLYQVISAGITDTAEAQLFMNKATIAAVGGSAELSDVILAGTKAITAFGLDVSDTDRVMDVFAGTVKAGQTTMGELAQAFPTVAGMAGQAGMTIEETLGTFAGLTKVLAGSEETATSLSAVIRGFIKPTTDMSDAVKALGFESASVMVKEIGLNESLKLLNKHVDGDTEAIGKLFPNVRALKAVFPLLGLSAEDVATSIDIVSNSAGLSQKQFEDMQNTVQYQWGVAMSEARNMLIDIGRVVNKTLAPAIKFMGDVIKKVSKFWLDLSEPIKKTIIVITAITAGILLLGGALMIMIGLKSLIVWMLVAATTAIWGAVTASLAFVAANIWWIVIVLAVIAVIGLLIAAGVWLVKNWDKIVFAAKTMGVIMKNVFIGIRNVVVSVWNFIVGFIEKAINGIIKMINLLIKGINIIPGINIGLIGKVSLGGLKGEMAEFGELPTMPKESKEDRITNINIEGDVLGTDPDNMADAFADKMDNVIRLN